MAPDTPEREPEMQDTPPCRCPTKWRCLVRLRFFVSDLDTASRMGVSLFRFVRPAVVPLTAGLLVCCKQCGSCL